MKRLIALVLITASVVFAQDTTMKFVKDLREFLDKRAGSDPMGKKWTDSNAKEEAVFAYRKETMTLFRDKFLARCTSLAKQANDADLEKSCTTAHHPTNLVKIVENFEKGTPKN